MQVHLLLGRLRSHEGKHVIGVWYPAGCMIIRVIVAISDIVGIIALLIVISVGQHGG